jgi:hypothetical protein
VFQRLAIIPSQLGVLAGCTDRSPGGRPGLLSSMDIFGRLIGEDPLALQSVREVEPDPVAPKLATDVPLALTVLMVRPR